MPVAALISLLAPLLPGIITSVEGLFAKKSPNAPTGPQKADSVAQIATAILGAMQTSGALPAGSSIDTSQLATVIESVFQHLNSTGQVNKPETKAKPLPAASAPVPTQALPGPNFTGSLKFQNGIFWGIGS